MTWPWIYWAQPLNFSLTPSETSIMIPHLADEKTEASASGLVRAQNVDSADHSSLPFPLTVITVSRHSPGTPGPLHLCLRSSPSAKAGGCSLGRPSSLSCAVFSQVSWPQLPLKMALCSFLPSGCSFLWQLLHPCGCRFSFHSLVSHGPSQVQGGPPRELAI